MPGAVLINLALVIASLGGARPTWELPGVEVRIDVRPDRTLRVTELLHVNFADHPRRGIDRELPTRIVHPLAGALDLDVRVERVTRDGELPVHYRLQRRPRFLAVEIGDPDSTRSGETIYRLEYTVRGAIVERLHREQLFWPAVSGEWDASILQSEVLVRLPREVDADRILARSFTGFFDEQGRAADLQLADPGRVVFRQPSGLGAHRRLTVELSWPRAAGAVPAAQASSARPGAGVVPLVAALLAAVLAVALLIDLRRQRRSGR